MLEMMLSASASGPAEGQIIKVQPEGNRLFALDLNGDLYARGVDSASSGVLGNNGVSSIGAWVKILTNVRDFWVSPQFTLMNTNEGRWFWNGRYLDGGTSPVLVPTEIITNFSAVTSPVKKLVVGSYGAALLDTSGKLYTMGRNQTGWLYNGGTTVNHTVMTLRSETNILDIEMSKLYATFYIHYDDLSVVGSGNSQFGQLGNTATNNTSLVVVSAASQATTKVVAGTGVVFLFQNVWYFIGTNSNNQAGATPTGMVTTRTIISGSGVIVAGKTLVSDGYKTWIKGLDNLWYFSGNGTVSSGTITTSVVPWNASTMTAFTQIPVTGYPILSDPLTWGASGGVMSYFLYEGFLYGCGNSTANKLLPGNGTSNNLLGFRKLNNDFAFVE